MKLRHIWVPCIVESGVNWYKWSASYCGTTTSLKKSLDRLPYCTHFCREISHCFYCKWNQGSKDCIPPHPLHLICADKYNLSFFLSSLFFLSFFLSSLFFSFFLSCRCRGLVLHLTTLSRTFLDEESDCHSNLNLTTKQHSKGTDIHAPSRISTNNPSQQAAKYPRLRLHCNQDPAYITHHFINFHNYGDKFW